MMRWYSSLRMMIAALAITLAMAPSRGADNPPLDKPPTKNCPLARGRRREFRLPPLAAGDAGGDDDRLGAALDAELLQDRRDMGLDGRLRDAELIGDLLVEQTLRQHHQHAHL